MPSTLMDELDDLNYIRKRVHGPGKELVQDLLNSKIAEIEKKYNVTVVYNENLRRYWADSK